MNLNRLLYSLVICLLLVVGITNLCFSDIDQDEKQANTPYGIIYPLQPGTWISGIFESLDNEDHFSFEAQSDSEYIIIASPVSIKRLELILYDEDGTTVIAKNNPWDDSSNSIKWTCSSSGTYILSVKPFQGSTGTYNLSVQIPSARFNRIISLIKDNRCHEAINEQLNFLEAIPDDPEVNLYTAILRIIDILETPDNRLLSIYSQFGIEFDLIPSSVHISNPTDTMLQASEIQSYAVENILPVIDESLQNLNKAINYPELFVFFSPIVIEKEVDPNDPYNGYDNTEAKTDWVQIDNADVHITAGLLLITKSMILTQNAFDMGIEPKVVAERFYPNPTDPILLDSLLIEYPNLLSGKSNIQDIFRSAIRNWLLGTQKIREGLNRIASRKTPQDIHLFFLKNSQNAAATARYLSFLDRVFTGLLIVSGGDFNGDTAVNNWDLHELSSFIKRN